MAEAEEAGPGHQTAQLRSFFARYITARSAAKDHRIEEAFAAVLRESFAGPGPWSILVTSPWNAGACGPSYIETPSADPAFLYQDTLVALDPTQGINIGEPSLHARCLDACSLRPGETVVQVGAGSGYYTALLAHLVGPTGRVHAFEIHPALAVRAKRNLEPWPWVEVHARSGAEDGLPPTDVVYVNAGISQPSQAWIEALRPGGRLIFPLQSDHGFGGMLMVERPVRGGMAWPARFVSRASFIACQARQDKRRGRELDTAFAGGGAETVRSLRLEGKPNDTCWFDGGDWWLSTETVQDC